MAARFFLHCDHLAKVVLLGTPFLRPVQYDRTFLESVQYGNLLHVFTNANSRERFPGYIINRGYSNFLLNMTFISSSEVDNICIFFFFFFFWFTGVIIFTSFCSKT